jgi:hypothetical protein
MFHSDGKLDYDDEKLLYLGLYSGIIATEIMYTANAQVKISHFICKYIRCLELIC